jgi:pyrimidine-nucleoside phosphorylase
MRAVDIIRKKRDGNSLDQAEIEAFVSAATHHTWPEYQVSALLMAVVLRGMSADETAWLTAAMIRSGSTLDWSDLPGPKVDKHSTGGVGDKTSLILAPLAAACGCVVPMMSGRGLGHTGGTLDKLESIPGFRVRLSLPDFRSALQNVGCALIGQTAEIAPADKVLYALRDVTATVESIALIAASIMSKKIAEGIQALVMDVKFGRGAFMKRIDDARVLARTLVDIGNANGVRTEALLTAMDTPLGHNVGNALEVIESIETLKGNGPKDLESLSVTLVVRMLLLAGVAQSEAGAEARVREALGSGAGLDKLRAIIRQQGGDPVVIDDYNRFELARDRAYVTADKSGFVSSLDAELVGRAAMILGAGRDRVDDRVDPGVGVTVLKKPGARLCVGERIMELYHRGDARTDRATDLLRAACVIAERPPAPLPLIREIIE